jgi:hypothetical protein
MTLTGVGTQTLTYSDIISGMIRGISNPITVIAGTVTQFSVTTSPTTTAAGTAIGVTVVAENAYGIQVQGYLGTVHFTSSDPHAVLPADYQFTANNFGRQTFVGVILNTVGTETITASDTVNAAITGTATVSVLAPAVRKARNQPSPEFFGWAPDVLDIFYETQGSGFRWDFGADRNSAAS